jgi:hypothetical protein
MPQEVSSTLRRVIDELCKACERAIRLMSNCEVDG